MKIFAFFMLSISTLSCATPRAMEDIQTLYIYDYFGRMGYTTASAFSQHGKLRKTNTLKIEVEQDDCKHFNQILKNAQSKKHFQTKLGTNVIFIEIGTGTTTLNAIICSSRVVIDLSNHREYRIKDEGQQKWIAELVQKHENASETD